MSRLGFVVLIGALLFASALSLITAQHRSRSLFIDLQRAQGDAKRLDVDHDRLRIEQSRLSQPAYVEAAARKIGLKPIDSAGTVFLSLPAPEPKK
jgi:cell division protein FtsL